MNKLVKLALVVLALRLAFHFGVTDSLDRAWIRLGDDVQVAYERLRQARVLLVESVPGGTADERPAR